MELLKFDNIVIDKILFWCDYNPSLIFTCKLFCSYAKKILTPMFFTDVQLRLLTNLQTLYCGENRK
ncbi:hypothetical protein OAG24_00755, partial [bacterium]|nr:hypothetical protein [bacterium]